MQDCPANTEENLGHALLHCAGNDDVGHQLLNCLRNVEPGLQAEAVLRLELPIEEDTELPVVWLLATVLQTLWNLKQSSTKVRQYLIRSQLEADINLLRETRYRNAVNRIEGLAANLFS